MTYHPRIELSNLWPVWFPPNTITIPQPMDQGVTPHAITAKAMWKPNLLTSNV